LVARTTLCWVASSRHRKESSANGASAAGVLRSEAGRQFDSQVVAAFLAVLEERPWG
jgi:HD-GYP domain-containing protein (c-di-GMP phosphodiesterase class II)